MNTIYVLFLMIKLGLSFDSDIPDINDLFSTFTGNLYFDTKELPQGVIVKNISIDLEKLDMKKFKENMDFFAQKLIGNASELEENVIAVNDTRRLAYIGSAWYWNRAWRAMLRTKLLDMMLQKIYMARHKLKQVESEKYFNPKDTSYRIGFLHRRIRRIWKRMRDIYTTMIRNRNKKYSVFEHVEPYIVLHHKAAKLHVDFLYLWWVLIKLHEKYDIRHGYPATIPSVYS